MIGLSGSLLIARADPVPSRPGVRMLRMPRLVRALAGAIVAPMRFKQHAAGVALAICVLLPAPAAAQTAGFVYTLFNIDGAPNQLFGSVLGLDGSLTDLPGFPIGTGGNARVEVEHQLHGELHRVVGPQHRRPDFQASLAVGRPRRDQRR